MQGIPGASIIVPAYNAEATIGACLRALLAQRLDAPFEVIVVDDGSSDATALEAERFAPGVRVVRSTHRGAAAARNEGARQAVGSALLFTDADCQPAEGWAQHLLDALRSGADGAKGAYRTRQRGLVARWVQVEYEERYRRMARLSAIDFIDTYSAAYRRDVFEEAAGFDERLAVDEDQELSFRLSAQGRRLIFVPEAVVYHRHVDSLPAYLRRKFRIGVWKVPVGIMHPARLAGDSHTTRSLKLQVGLAAVVLTLLPASALSRRARRGLEAAVAIFLASTLGVTRLALRRDPAVALIAPAMCVLRAVALLAGLVAGALRFGTAGGMWSGRDKGAIPHSAGDRG